MNLETNGMDQVVVITIMTVVVWVIVRFAAIRQFMFRRKVLDDTELSGLFAANDLDASKVLMILRIIGRCYNNNDCGGVGNRAFRCNKAIHVPAKGAR